MKTISPTDNTHTYTHLDIGVDYSVSFQKICSVDFLKLNQVIFDHYYTPAKDGEALYSQQKQDWELTVAQIMNFLLSNSD